MCHPLLFKQTNVTLAARRSLLLCYPPPLWLWLRCQARPPHCPRGDGGAAAADSPLVHWSTVPSWKCEDLQGVVPQGGPMVDATTAHTTFHRT